MGTSFVHNRWVEGMQTCVQYRTCSFEKPAHFNQITIQCYSNLCKLQSDDKTMSFISYVLRIWKIKNIGAHDHEWILNKSDLVLLREFRVVFKVLNAAILGVRSLTSKKEKNWDKRMTGRTNLNVSFAGEAPEPYNQADMDLVGRSRLATSSSLSAVPL